MGVGVDFACPSTLQVPPRRIPRRFKRRRRSAGGRVDRHSRPRLGATGAPLVTHGALVRRDVLNLGEEPVWAGRASRALDSVPTGASGTLRVRSELHLGSRIAAAPSRRWT